MESTLDTKISQPSLRKKAASVVNQNIKPVGSLLNSCG